MSDSTVRGRFVWHELMTTDTKSAAGFFTKVIGWKTQPSPRDPSYTIFISGGRFMAGLMVLPEEAKAMGAPPNWLTYIGTPNVDDTAQQVVALGGKILKPPADIPAIGRFAIVQDPQGAVFAAFTPQGEAGADAVPGLGDYSWHELLTTDWRAALTFYQKLFGWEATSSMDMGPGMGMYQMFGRNGRALGGIFNKPKEMQAPSSWLPYVRVVESRKTAETIKKAGGQVINGPMEVPGGDWIAQGLDLQGAVFAVHSLKPVEKKKAARPKKKPAAAAKKSAKPKTVKKRAAKKPARKARSPKRTPRAKRTVKKASRSTKRRR